MIYKILAISTIVLCHFGFSSTVTHSRNLLQFDNMIKYKGFSSLDYNGYGCWCGSGTHGVRTLDATDQCCKIHDECYDRIAGGVFGCSPKLVTYDWEYQPNTSIQCTDKMGTCDRKTCECDKVAVDCFQRNRRTYSTRFLKMGNSTYMAKLCNA